MNAIIQEPWAMGLGRLRPDVIRTKEDLLWSETRGGHCKKDGKQSETNSNF